MKRLWITLLVIGTLLCCGIVAAENPVREPVDKLVLIHYKDKVDTMGFSASDQAPFYKLLGVKWGTFPVGYSINPANSGLNDHQVIEEIIMAFTTWDVLTSTDLFRYEGTTVTAVAQYDGINVVFWGDYPNEKVIAMTSIWYTRYTKEIVETDIQMNSNQPWGIDPDGEGSKPLKNAFDIRNIITHESGHICGLGDLYNKPASELTLYGYSSPGEVKKDSPGTGDILGLRKLYGI